MASLIDDRSLSMNVDEDDYWQVIGREQCPATAGFVVIQAAVAQMIKQWAINWTETLQSFDDLRIPVEVQVSSMPMSNL